MNVLAVGLSHRTADLNTLEQVAVTQADLPKVLHQLQQSPDITEVMLLSTCNRIEVYAIVEAFHGGLTSVSTVLADKAGVEPTALYDNLYVHYAAAAVEHIFSVASGLDSMVLGETQILGQVRSAYAEAGEAGTVGSALHNLVQTTLRVGKRVHTETGLGEVGASVVSEALADAGDVSGRSAVIVGAGSMGALAASQLRKSGVGRIVVANRTMDNARRLAENITETGGDAHAIELAGLADALADADIAVCCTGARAVVVKDEHVLPRQGRPLIVCDLGLPHDVDRDIGERDDVRIIDLETVRRRMDASATSDTAKQTARASGIVLDEVREYLAGQRSAEVTPTVAALRKQAAEVVDAELLRLHRRMPELDGEVRDEVGKTVRRVVDKLLHTPTVRVKQLAADPASTDYAGALRELFGLDPAAPVAVSKPAAHTPKHEQIDTDGETQ